MTAFRYTPGPWRAVVHPAGVVVLPASVGGALLDAVWESLAAGAGLAAGSGLAEGSGQAAGTGLAAGSGLAAVLESLTGAFGTSLSALPPFAVATLASPEAGAGAAAGGGMGVRLAVRGPLTITVTEPDAAPYEISGAEVTTWAERVVPAATHLTLTPLPSPTAPAGRNDQAEWLSIASGVVPSGQVELDLTDVAARAVAPAAVPQAPTAPPEATTALPEVTIVPEEASVVADEGTAVADEVSVVPGEGTAVPDEATAVPDEGAVVAGGAGDPEPARAAAVEPEHPPVSTSASAESTEVSTGQAGTGRAGTTEAGTTEAGTAEPEPHERASDDDVAEELAHTRTELPDDAYDHLWGATVVKSVEEAAVRDLDDEEHEEAASAPAPAASAAPDAPQPPATEQPPAPAPPPPLPPVSSGLIDSVPGISTVGASSGSAGFDAHTVPPTPPAPAPSAPTATSIPSAASTPLAASTPPGAAGDDHDGLTITVSELEAMRRLDAAAGEPAPALPGSALGRIVLSTGESHALDRPIIIGRRPRANRVQADQVPTLVTVASPEQDISRNHLEVRLEGRHVLAVDLATTNGSILHREGTPTQRLTPSEPVLVLAGDIVDIGDGVTITFEDIP